MPSPSTRTLVGRPGPIGPTGPAGPAGVDGPAGPTGPTTIGDSGMAFETRAALVTATVEAVRKYAHTSGYAAFGDGGHGLYKRRATAPSDPTNPAYPRSVDRYTSAGATDATHGGYWELVPEGGRVNIEQFGGKADGISGTVGTDNLAPFLAAIGFGQFAPYGPEPTFQHTHEIRFGLGKYRFSNGPEVLKVARVRGLGSVLDSQGTASSTQWLLPVNARGLLVSNSNTSGEDNSFSGTSGVDWRTGAGTVIEGISIVFDPGSTDSTKRGVHLRGQAVIRDIRVHNAPGAAFYVHATSGSGGATEGDVNDCVIENCAAHQWGFGTSGDGPRAGLYIEGNDANAIHVKDFMTHGNLCRGTAIIDASGSGCNIFDACQLTGYGNRGVHRGGRRYVLISYSPGIGSSTTPGADANTDLIWYDIGAGGVDASYPEWSGAETYYPESVIITGGQPSIFINPYREGAGITHAPGGTTIIDGNVGGTRYTNVFRSNAGTTGSGILSQTGVGGIQQRVSGQLGYTLCGVETYARLGYFAGGDAAEQNKGLGIWGHFCSVDNQKYDFRYYNGDLVYHAGFTATPIWEITTAATAAQFGRGAAQPGFIGFYDLVLKDRTNSNNVRVIGMRESEPASGAHARGEFFFNINPSAGGVLGWSCITSGTPGTWKAIPVPA